MFRIGCSFDDPLTAGGTPGPLHPAASRQVSRTRWTRDLMAPSVTPKRRATSAYDSLPRKNQAEKLADSPGSARRPRFL